MPGSYRLLTADDADRTLGEALDAGLPGTDKNRLLASLAGSTDPTGRGKLGWSAQLRRIALGSWRVISCTRSTSSPSPRKVQGQAVR